MIIQRDHMGVTPLGFSLRVIVNETPLNIEKTTSSVISVLLLAKNFQFKFKNFTVRSRKLWNRKTTLTFKII